MNEQPNGEEQQPSWKAKDAFFSPLLGVVETVKHHHWNDVSDWRFYHHAESHIIAEGYNV